MSNIYERDWNHFDQENFILDYLTVDWADEKDRFFIWMFFEEIQFNSW